MTIDWSMNEAARAALVERNTQRFVRRASNGLADSRPGSGTSNRSPTTARRVASALSRRAGQHQRAALALQHQLGAQRPAVPQRDGADHDRPGRVGRGLDVRVGQRQSLDRVEVRGRDLAVVVAQRVAEQVQAEQLGDVGRARLALTSDMPTWAVILSPLTFSMFSALVIETLSVTPPCPLTSAMGLPSLT